MQERFTHQLISDLSASAASEIWEYSKHLISEKYLLYHGIREELHQKASERIRDYAEQQLTHAPSKTKIHPQFADQLWPVIRREIDTRLEPMVDIFFHEYCQLLRSGSIRYMIVTPIVITYFDHFCEALRHSAVECLEFPQETAMSEGGICKVLVLNTPRLQTIVCEDICSTLLTALSARHGAGMSVPEEYHVTDAYALPSYVRLARWYQETALSVRVTIKEPERSDHRRFLADKLQSRSQITNKDVDWILEQWHTGRKRLRDAENCPKCGQYDPRGRHYFRFIPGRGQYNCQSSAKRVSGTGVGKRRRHVALAQTSSDTNSEESARYPQEPLVSSDDAS